MTFPFPPRWRRAFAAATLVFALCGAPRAFAVAAPQDARTVQPAEAEQLHGEGWWPALWKTANFAILVGGLTYFLRRPLAAYLRGRSDTIRRDLVSASELRTSAERQLDEVRARLAALPAELEALRERGQRELDDERVRMKDATAHERERLLDRTRREIDLQFRVARRALLDHAAELSVSLARKRIERDITPDDQQRLIERYVHEVRP